MFSILDIIYIVLMDSSRCPRSKHFSLPFVHKEIHGFIRSIRSGLETAAAKGRVAASVRGNNFGA
jgi:hypothetical protein